MLKVIESSLRFSEMKFVVLKFKFKMGSLFYIWVFFFNFVLVEILVELG